MSEPALIAADASNESATARGWLTPKGVVPGRSVHVTCSAPPSHRSICPGLIGGGSTAGAVCHAGRVSSTHTGS